jgi:hypothetical protein
LPLLSFVALDAQEVWDRDGTNGKTYERTLLIRNRTPP